AATTRERPIGGEGAWAMARGRPAGGNSRAGGPRTGKLTTGMYRPYWAVQFEISNLAFYQQFYYPCLSAIVLVT
ncbi:hypothetical protein GW17_00043025, partial [Ensete ventricosum]